MQIRITKDLAGVYPELQPEVGGIYTAVPGKPRSGIDFCVLTIKDKYIVVREGVYEILRRDPEDEKKQPPLWREKEKKVEYIKEALPVQEAPKEEKKPAPKKRGPKPKEKKPESMLPPETERAMERLQIADLQEIIHDLRLELAEETTRRYKAERALLKLTIERYGGE